MATTWLDPFDYDGPSMDFGPTRRQRRRAEVIQRYALRALRAYIDGKPQPRDSFPDHEVRAEVWRVLARVQQFSVDVRALLGEDR
jgi:hypothetical protein